jgi:hypothetical protein
MTTPDNEFTDRAAHDRPLNDRYSTPDTTGDETEGRESRRAPGKPRSGKPERKTGESRPTFEEPRPATGETGPTVGNSRTTAGTPDTTPGTPGTTPGDRTPDARDRTGDRTGDRTTAVEPAPKDVISSGAGNNSGAGENGLFGSANADRFRTQWREVQASFVDEPRSAVREAEKLVGEMLDELKSHLGEDRGDDTEELRIALRRYRSLVDQILAV